MKLCKSRKRTLEEKRERALREIVESEHLRRAFFALTAKQGFVSKTSLRALAKAGLIHGQDRPILTQLGRDAVTWEKTMKKDTESSYPYVVIDPGALDKPVLDKDGNPLSEEESREYWDDVIDGGVPMSPKYLREYLWPKWGERLGIPKPKPEET